MHTQSTSTPRTPTSCDARFMIRLALLSPANSTQWRSPPWLCLLLPWMFEEDFVSAYELCIWIGTAELLEQIPALQQFLFHALGCRPRVTFSITWATCVWSHNGGDSSHQRYDVQQTARWIEQVRLNMLPAFHFCCGAHECLHAHLALYSVTIIHQIWCRWIRRKDNNNVKNKQKPSHTSVNGLGLSNQR